MLCALATMSLAATLNVTWSYRGGADALATSRGIEVYADDRLVATSPMGESGGRLRATVPDDTFWLSVRSVAYRDPDGPQELLGVVSATVPAGRRHAVSLVFNLDDPSARLDSKDSLTHVDKVMQRPLPRRDAALSQCQANGNYCTEACSAWHDGPSCRRMRDRAEVERSPRDPGWVDVYKKWCSFDWDEACTWLDEHRDLVREVSPGYRTPTETADADAAEEVARAAAKARARERWASTDADYAARGFRRVGDAQPFVVPIGAWTRLPRKLPKGPHLVVVELDGPATGLRAKWGLGPYLSEHGADRDAEIVPGEGATTFRVHVDVPAGDFVTVFVDGGRWATGTLAVYEAPADVAEASSDRPYLGATR